MSLLKFSKGNNKLNLLAKFLAVPCAHVVSFDLPAGFTCSKTKICKTFSNRITGKLTKIGRVTCYAAKSEMVFKNKRAANWYNLDQLNLCSFGRDTAGMVALIETSLPKQTKIVRIHSYGDYYTQEYFQAWLTVATSHPEIVFYGYTKHLDYALADKPDNFSLQYSFGSEDDDIYLNLEVKPAACFIGEEGTTYPYKVVCGSHETAHEDYFAIRNGEDFVIGQH